MGAAESSMLACNSLLVRPDRAAAFGGEAVTGAVLLNLTEPLPAGTQLQLLLSGHESTAWEEGDADSSSSNTSVAGAAGADRHGYRDVLRTPVALPPLPRAPDGRVPPGQYSLPFAFVLPINLPPSLNAEGATHHGRVAYELRALCAGPAAANAGGGLAGALAAALFGGPALEAAAPLAVCAPLAGPIGPLRADAEHMLYACCCFFRGHVDLLIDLEKSAYVPGELARLRYALRCHAPAESVRTVAVALRRTLKLRDGGGRVSVRTDVAARRCFRGPTAQQPPARQAASPGGAAAAAGAPGPAGWQRLADADASPSAAQAAPAPAAGPDAASGSGGGLGLPFGAAGMEGLELPLPADLEPSCQGVLVVNSYEVEVTLDMGPWVHAVRAALPVTIYRPHTSLLPPAPYGGHGVGGPPWGAGYAAAPGWQPVVLGQAVGPMGGGAGAMEMIAGLGSQGPGLGRPAAAAGAPAAPVAAPGPASSSSWPTAAAGAGVPAWGVSMPSAPPAPVWAPASGAGDAGGAGGAAGAPAPSGGASLAHAAVGDRAAEYAHQQAAAAAAARLLPRGAASSGGGGVNLKPAKQG